ncbi:MAG: glutamate-5-semialdehyde dehydrogenase [Acidobacteria bacterium]|nr:MAG: glutamate-5-semialdehyde dehydrogenase [Acidobacteriota bacterium]PYU55737.1 MAG: glutamate-5-semialdehyde dehydrogenase [Acidobacteriota bacterium]PYU66476.1 MAG: glutamate-5-semialdehyde dehydrogenase [Acidobacteriota bacterium]PYU76424.1 MAG: glutamate-5-semialdehyde dehydrogenase [Acidobacteriota bacterium]
MSKTLSTRPLADVASIARSAREASRKLALLSGETRNAALLTIADALEGNGGRVLAANARDCAAAETLASTGEMTPAMLSRLRINESGITEMAARIREVANLPDPLGKRLAATELDQGLILHKESCPLGVIAVVFESRPDVVPQVASLALKSGNAVLLKGGAEAANSNESIVAVWREALCRFPDVPQESIHLLQSRSDVLELLRLRGEVDLLIPRGSKEFVAFMEQNSRIPVVGHGEGICHVFVDRAADLNRAVTVTLDSKVQYPAACNSVETLLVHKDVAAAFLPRVVAELNRASVEVRGCPRVLALLPEAQLVPAIEKDWSTEYSDLILSVKIVDTVEQALEHIQRYGSKHTECIVTEDQAVAERFLQEVDAAGVFHNASTRFADGYRYGLGAELGISNGKLHARGPMGIEGLTTYKYKLRGNGHIAAEYSSGVRHFTHKPLG